MNTLSNKGYSFQGSNTIIRNISHIYCDCYYNHNYTHNNHNDDMIQGIYESEIRLFNEIKGYISDNDTDKIRVLYDENDKDNKKHIPVTNCMINDSIYKNNIDIFDILIRKYISSYADKMIFDRLIINHIIEYDKYDFIKRIITDYDSNNVIVDCDTNTIIEYCFNHNDNLNIAKMICNDRSYIKTSRQHILAIRNDPDKTLFKTMISRLEKDKREDTLISIFSHIITKRNIGMILDKLGPKIKTIDTLIELMTAYQYDEDIIRYILESFDMNIETIDKKYFMQYIDKTSILYDIIVNEYRYDLFFL